MRSITFKLLLAFLAVSLVSILAIVLSARWATDREFRTFLVNQTRNNLVVTLADYYEQNGTWDGVNGILTFGRLAPSSQFAGNNRLYTVADSTGKVVVAGLGDEVGDQLSQADLDGGLPIQVRGLAVGTLITRQPAVGVGPTEKAFLDRIKGIFAVSGVIVVGLVLLIGFLLSRNFSRPIRELTQATHAMSAGKLVQEIPVRSHDELGELTAAFNKMNAELARSTSLRRQMTADIAHELRTPISVILGHAEAVHDGLLPPSAETFEIVRDEAGRLEKLIEDLRTLSRADAGELPIEPQSIAPVDLLRKVQVVHKHRAAQKDIALEVEAAPALPDFSADLGRMQQVLNNLVDNAFRYTPSGGTIRLSAGRVDGQLEFRVQDTGPGIPPGDLERVFERFYRSDPSRQRDESGSGLGLAIARSLVEKHNGRIWAESLPGQGAAIVIRLPY
jgi:two-component system, OmpR family, sensor histidine kinase BaeS